MKNTLSYKGFIGSVSYSDEDGVLFGKIEGINDLVTYESTEVSDLVKQFRISTGCNACKNAGYKFKSIGAKSYRERNTSGLISCTKLLFFQWSIFKFFPPCIF